MLSLLVHGLAPYRGGTAASSSASMPPKKDDKKKGKGDADKQLISKSLRVTYQASCKALDVKPLKKLQLDMQKAEEEGLKLVDRIAAQDYSARTLSLSTRIFASRSPCISPGSPRSGTSSTAREVPG